MENKKLTALEALKDLRADAKNHLDKHIEYLNERLDVIEKELKVLEIIKLKQVNIFIYLHSSDLETYNDMVEDDRKLTQQEYDLLKEVLL